MSTKYRAKVARTKGTASHCGPDGAFAPAATLNLDYDNDVGLFYLIRYDLEGQYAGDTVAFSLEEAFKQADFEYELTPEGWQLVAPDLENGHRS